MHDAGTFGGVRVPFARKIQIDGLAWENIYIYIYIYVLLICVRVCVILLQLPVALKAGVSRMCIPLWKSGLCTCGGGHKQML